MFHLWKLQKLNWHCACNHVTQNFYRIGYSQKTSLQFLFASFLLNCRPLGLRVLQVQQSYVLGKNTSICVRNRHVLHVSDMLKHLPYFLVIVLCSDMLETRNLVSYFLFIVSWSVILETRWGHVQNTLTTLVRSECNLKSWWRINWLVFQCSFKGNYFYIVNSIISCADP